MKISYRPAFDFARLQGPHQRVARRIVERAEIRGGIVAFENRDRDEVGLDVGRGRATHGQGGNDSGRGHPEHYKWITGSVAAVHASARLLLELIACPQGRSPMQLPVGSPRVPRDSLRADRRSRVLCYASMCPPAAVPIRRPNRASPCGRRRPSGSPPPAWCSPPSSKAARTTTRLLLRVGRVGLGRRHAVGVPRRLRAVRSREERNQAKSRW